MVISRSQKNQVEVNFQPKSEQGSCLVDELRQLSQVNWQIYLEKIVIFSKERGLVAPVFCLSLSLAFLGSEEMRRVNKQYRDRDETTDVLSFAYERELDSGEQIIRVEGEMLFCGSVIEERARENRESLEKKDGRLKSEQQKTPRIFYEEFYLDLAHGCLHLLGYEHGEEMFKLQEELAGRLLEN
jgi:probable rRNA maturation factor